MNIDSNDPRITAYVFGELVGEDRNVFEAELAASDELRDVVEQTRKTVQLIESDLASTPAVQLRPEQRETIVSTFERPRVAPAPAPTGDPRRWMAWAVTAALLLIVGAISIPLANRMVTVAEPEASVSSDRSNDASRDAHPMEEVDEMGSAMDAAAPEEPSDTRAFGGGSVAPSGALAEHSSPPGRMMRMAPSQATPAAPAAPQSSQPKAAMGATPAPLSLPAERASAGPSRGQSAALDPAASASRPLTIAQQGAARTPGEPQGKPANDARIARGMQMGMEEPLETRGMAMEGMGMGMGMGMGGGGPRYAPFIENDFVRAMGTPRSTFSVDVDTAAYSQVRQFLERATLPPPEVVRLEELVNYFPYGYEGPQDADVPFATHLAVSACPWAPEHRLVRVAIKAKEISTAQRPPANLIFLVDVSGSMRGPKRLPLLKRGLSRLVQQLRDDDRIGVVTYSANAARQLPSTPGSQKQEIISALNRLQAGGSTNGGAGLRAAYQMTREHLIEDGVNRVILCSDGDFNVGITGNSELAQMVERGADDGIGLTVLGFGMDNLNDQLMEEISNRGDGNYAMIDNDAEADRVLVDQVNGTLVTIAKNVKVQVDFNHRWIESYRMLGYENRRLNNEDFDNDQVDAGEIGAGHTVTMLYEIVPAKSTSGVDLPGDGQSKYLQAANAASDEMLEVRIRYMLPSEEQSRLLQFPLLRGAEVKFGEADPEFRFASAVASFGMLLRNSTHRGDTSYDAVLEIAKESAGADVNRLELLKLIQQAKGLSGQ